MNFTVKPLPKRLDLAHAMIQHQSAQISSQDAQIVDLKKHVALLEDYLRLERARRYGRSSEQYVDPNDPQGQLFDEQVLEGCGGADDAPESETKEVAAHKRTINRGKRDKLPEYLERVRVEHTLPEDELTGPNGERFTKIGEVISEQLDIVPATVRVIQNVRFQYAVKGQEELGVKTAPQAKQLILKSIATPGLLAHIATAKYAHHLPLYRQSEIWRSLDVKLSTSSLSRWVVQIGEALQSLVDYQLEDMKQHGHIHADETPVTVLKDKNKVKTKGQSHRGYMWVYTNHLGVVYRYASTRAGHNVVEVLSDYQGYVQSDAYSGYDALFDDDQRTRVGCFAHARRKFTDVQKATKKKSAKAAYVLKQMGKLYKLEQKAKVDKLNTEQIKLLRQTEAIPILEKLKQYLTELKPKVVPSSLLGKAIAYSLNNWDALSCYAESGLTNIDNNPAENAIRPFAVGRKNWLFCGNNRGAEASANILSLIESAKLYHLKVFDYLSYVFTHLPNATTPRALEQLLPQYAREHVPSIKPLVRKKSKRQSDHGKV